MWYARQELAAGRIDLKQFVEMVASSAPSVGHCNTMGTALSMNSMAEALGLSLTGCAAIPGPYRERGQMAYETGKRIVDMVWEDLKPSDILTRKAFENAIVAASALGASTNCPPHVNAIARHIGVKLDNADWDKIGYDIPLLVNCMPAGQYLGEAFHRAGGVPTVMAELLKKKKGHGDALTVTGKTMAENVAKAKPADGDVIKSYDKPMLGQAGFAVLSGNLFDSAIMKTSVISTEFRKKYLERKGDRGRLRRHGDRVRRTRGLSPSHQRSGPADRREQHPVHPQCRPGRLSRCGRGGEHAAARPAGEGRRAAAALRRRWPAERHLGQPVDPQRLAGSRRRRRAGAAQDGDKVRVDIGKRRADILIPEKELAERKAALEAARQAKARRRGRSCSASSSASSPAAPASTSRSTIRGSSRPRACPGTRIDWRAASAPASWTSGR